MEASQAGVGDGGDAGQTQEAGEQQQAGPDFNAMQEQLGQVGSNMEQMYQFLQSEPWAQQQQGEPEGEPEPESLDLGFLDTGDPEYNQQLAAGLQSLIQTEAQKVAQQQMGPLQQELAQHQERWTAFEADKLGDEFPELRDEQAAERLVTASRHLAEEFGQPELANNPGFWRVTHLALSAMRAAQEEQQAGSEPVAHLEGGGGAGAGAQQVSPVDLIMNPEHNGGLGAGVLNFGR